MAGCGDEQELVPMSAPAILNRRSPTLTARALHMLLLTQRTSEAVSLCQQWCSRLSAAGEDESDEARDARLWLAIAQSERAWREVLELYEELAERGRTPQARAGYWLGVARLAEVRFMELDTARSAYRSALENDPSNQAARNGAARLLTAPTEGEGLPDWLNLEFIHREDADALESSREVGGIADSDTSTQRLISDVGQSRNVSINRMGDLMRAGRLAEAARTAEELLLDDPNDLTVRLVLRRLACTQDDFVAADAHWRKRSKALNPPGLVLS